MTLGPLKKKNKNNYVKYQIKCWKKNVNYNNNQLWAGYSAWVLVQCVYNEIDKDHKIYRVLDRGEFSNKKGPCFCPNLCNIILRVKSTLELTFDVHLANNMSLCCRPTYDPHLLTQWPYKHVFFCKVWPWLRALVGSMCLWEGFLFTESLKHRKTTYILFSLYEV